MVSLIIIICLSRYLNAFGKRQISIMVHYGASNQAYKKLRHYVVFREKERNFQESLISSFSASKTFVRHSL